MSLPSTQTAAIVPDVGQALQIKNNHPVPKPEDLKPGQCIVKISHTGVCHTDLHAKKGDWPIKPMNPLVGGHEGVGTVVAVKEGDVGPVKVGDRVGIKWLADSCLDCEFCRRGFEMNCPNAKLSGYTTDGTFSQYVLSYTHHVTPIPPSLQPADAASILCAGLTTYKALKVSNTKVGDWICIPGAGGGLGHLAVQYAKTMGLKVIAVDTGDEKRKLVENLGADKWIDFREGDLVSEIRKASGGLGVHAAVVAAASADAYTQAVQYLREGGTLVCVGMIDKSMEMTSFWTVYKSLRIQGSYVGNRQDAIEALDIAADGKVKVHYVLKKLKDLKDVYEDLEAGKISGRVVLEVDE